MSLEVAVGGAWMRWYCRRCTPLEVDGTDEEVEGAARLSMDAPREQAGGSAAAAAPLSESELRRRRLWCRDRGLRSSSLCRLLLRFFSAPARSLCVVVEDDLDTPRSFLSLPWSAELLCDFDFELPDLCLCSFLVWLEVLERLLCAMLSAAALSVFIAAATESLRDDVSFRRLVLLLREPLLLPDLCLEFLLDRDSVFLARESTFLSFDDVLDDDLQRDCELPLPSRSSCCGSADAPLATAASSALTGTSAAGGGGGGAASSSDDSVTVSYCRRWRGGSTSTTSRASASLSLD